MSLSFLTIKLLECKSGVKPPHKQCSVPATSIAAYRLPARRHGTGHISGPCLLLATSRRTLPLLLPLVSRRHGTGHGVGAALNVHEGPQSISTRWVPSWVAFLPRVTCLA